MEVARLRQSQPNSPAFTGMSLDRAQMLRKDPAWVSRQLHTPASRGIAAGVDAVLLDATESRLARLPLTPEQQADDEAILLGLEEEVALFAIDLEPARTSAPGRLPDDARVVSLREAGAELPQSEGGLAAYAAALLNWHRRHRFCPNCGGSTVIIEAGYARRCLTCQAMHFPRTDPVVIMLVEGHGRLLLGRRAGWPDGRYSVLAGFVSPGESAEEAVLREVKEESGIDVYRPEFVASQPWPFPSSLMLGFEVQADGGDPVNLDGELDDVGWFTREEVLSAAAERNTRLLLPPPISIARVLIDRWVTRQRSIG
jgi:NAD+ diphosphatase